MSFPLSNCPTVSSCFFKPCLLSYFNEALGILLSLRPDLFYLLSSVSIPWIILSITLCSS